LRQSRSRAYSHAGLLKKLMPQANGKVKRTRSL
jgi:hypothetical protein